MHDHSYIGCEHELKHCKHCDVVYCEKCKREWKQHASIFGQIDKDIWPRKRNDEPWKPNPQWSQPDVILCGHGTGDTIPPNYPTWTGAY